MTSFLDLFSTVSFLDRNITVQVSLGRVAHADGALRVQAAGGRRAGAGPRDEDTGAAAVRGG